MDQDNSPETHQGEPVPIARSSLLNVAAQVGRYVASTVVDILFPRRCVGCDREGAFICQACLEGLPRLKPPYCFLCARPDSLTLGLCPHCRDRPLEIDGIRSPYRMEGAIREAVHALKYRNVRALAPTLGQLLADFMEAVSMPADIIVPVPLHPKRERSRGYNQSLLLAKEVSGWSGIPLANGTLRRERWAVSQAGSHDEDQRWANVQGAFRAEPDLVRGKRVVVIDDVCTTGATLEACSIVLKQAGATSVWGLTLAKEA